MVRFQEKRAHEILSGISNAITISSRLREISNNVENAEFKNLLADLSLELADTKLKAAGLTSEMVKLREELDELKSADGIKCPSCGNKTFKIVSIRPHPTFGMLGVQERLHKCSSCGFEESKTVET